MKLNTRARYAVMAMVDLAVYGRAARPVTLAEIAGRQDISQAYLEQIFLRLRRAELVAGLRGPGGGYRLAAAPADISVADIVDAVDAPIRTTRCWPGDGGCTGNRGRCLTHDLWEELGNRIRLFLGSVSLADICDRRVPRAGPPFSAAPRRAVPVPPTPARTPAGP